MRRFRRVALWILGVVFLLLNAVAALHAWRFTHFEDPGVARTREKGLGLGEKLGILFTGVRNPKPLNTALPDTAFQTVFLQSDERLEAWWIPVAAPRGSVLLLHGYGGCKTGLLEKANYFRALGYSTLLLDFRGAGGSSGRQCTIGYREAADVRAGYAFLSGRTNGPIYLFGTSMGAAAALRALATDTLAVAGAVLECPFGTMSQTVKNRFRTQGVPIFPMAQLLLFWGSVENGFDAFAHDPEVYAHSVHCPVLLLWGEQDAKVTRAETDRIYTALAGPKRLVTFPNAGHENYLTAYAAEWSQAVAGLLEEKVHP